MKFGTKIGAALLRVCAFVAGKIWIFLAALLCVQGLVLYVAVSDVKVPERAVEFLFAPLTERGIRCVAGEVRLRNLTVIVASDVRAEIGGDPVLNVRRCAVKLAPEAILTGNYIPRMVQLSGVEVFCPAASSSTGTPERLISSGALLARRDAGKIFIDSAVCSVGGAKIIAYGEMPGAREFFFSPAAREEESSNVVSATPAAPAAPAAPTIVSSYSGAAGTLSALLRRAEVAAAADSASVELRFSPAGTRSVRAEVSLYLREANFFETLSLKNLTAKQNFIFTPSEKTLVPEGSVGVFSDAISFVAGNSFSEKIFGEARGISLAADFPANLVSPDVPVEARFPREIFVRADSLRFVNLREGELRLGATLASFAPRSRRSVLGDYAFRLNTSTAASRLAAAGTFSANPAAPTANLSFEIAPDKKELFSLPQFRALAKNKELAAIRFAEIPRLRGNAVFAPGMKFEKANVEFLAGTTFAGERTFRSLRLAGTATPDAVRLPEIRAVGPDFTAHADVFTEFSADGDFRVRTWGSVDPSYIDGCLGWFWERIWRDLRPAPAEKRPRADIDVYGNWGENWEYVFGAIAGENCWANGVIVDKVRLRVFEDPQLIAAFDMRFERGNDLVKGNLQWHYAMEPIYHYRDFRFLFSGSIPPKDVLQIVGEGLPEALSEIETEGAATAVVSGFFSGDENFYPELLRVSVRGEVPGAFSVFGIRGENFSGSILYDNGVVLVGAPFTANAGSGNVSGVVRVELPEDGHSAIGSKVEISLDLRGVSRSRLKETFVALGSRLAESAPDSAVPATEEPEEKTPDTSRIDASFAGELTIPELESLDASGQFSMHEPNLFELHVFGGFSRILSSLKIDLTSFNLDRVESTYTVRHGKVFLPDMHIFGESGEIFVQADIALPKLEIAGEAVFRNLRGTRIPLLGTLVKWGSASTELLPVKITGTADAPEWSVAPSLTRIWSTPEQKFGIAPEKTTDN